MVALLMYFKQLNCIYIYVYLWLAALAVVNAEEMLKPKPHETGTLNEETVRPHVIKPRGTVKIPAMPSETIKVAALGRPLFPGMLYDCRKDSFIPVITLWDRKSLSEDLDSRAQSQTNLQFSSFDSLNSKSSLLDVSASLKASFLGGLVDVGGSGKYLHDTKSSNHQSRVTMYYSETTRYEQLSMIHLGQITYPEVFEQKTATHVVIAVLYGAQAFMVFDQTFSEEENKQENEVKLDAMVKNIPKLSSDANAASKMTYTEKKMAEKITCSFHGDVRLVKNPTTYMEALNVHKLLPTLLKENPQNEVPIKVWLYPLHLLNTTAAQVEREISISVAFETEAIIEDLGKAERTLNDLLGNTLVNSFRDIKERLRSFQGYLRIYKAMLLKAVSRVLPAVRGGEMEEKSLEDILTIHKYSPFKNDMLNQFLKDATSELDLLTSLTKALEGIKIEDSDRLNANLLTVDMVISFTLTSLKYEHPYLSALKEFLKTDKFKELDGEQKVSVASFNKWFNDSDLSAKMKFNINLVKMFKRGYAGYENVLFIISAISDPSNPGSSVYLYEHGQLINKRIQYDFRMLAGLEN